MPTKHHVPARTCRDFKVHLCELICAQRGNLDGGAQDGINVRDLNICAAGTADAVQ